MRIELAMLAALGTMACAAQADGLTPSVEDATNLSAEMDVNVGAEIPPTLQDIASKPTADVDSSALSELTADPSVFIEEPCPPCGRG